jgi:O-antigen ligase
MATPSTTSGITVNTTASSVDGGRRPPVLRADPLLGVLPAALPLLVFVEIALFGADRLEIALLAALIQLGLLAWALLGSAGVRAALATPTLKIPAVLFVLVLVWGLSQLGPWPVGMAKSAWAAADATPAATLDKFATLAEVVKLAGLGAVFLLGVAAARNPLRAHRMMDWLINLGLLYAAASIVYFLRWGAPDPEGRLRLAGSLLNPNNTAALLTILAALATVAAVRLPSERARFRWPMVRPAALSGLAVWAAALTASRGGAVSGILGIATAGVLGAVSGRRKAGSAGADISLACAAVLLIGGALVLLSGGIMPERMLMFSDGVSDRLANIRLYASELDHVPWTGFGLGAFDRFNNLIAGSAEGSRLWQFGAMHNIVLQWVYEAGWPGTILMFGAMGAVVWQVIAGFRRAPSAPGAAAIAASVILLSHGMIDFDLQVPAIAALWALLLGLAWPADRRAADQLSSTPTSIR